MTMAVATAPSPVQMPVEGCTNPECRSQLAHADELIEELVDDRESLRATVTDLRARLGLDEVPGYSQDAQQLRLISGNDA